MVLGSIDGRWGGVVLWEVLGGSEGRGFGVREIEFVWLFTIRVDSMERSSGKVLSGEG